MTEKETSLNILSKTAKRVGTAIAGVALVAGGVKYGPALWEGITNPGEDSLVVSGVPGQVETYYSDSYIANPKIPVSTFRYWLGIEQCTADILAAKQGHPTQSFDPKVGERFPDCNFDWVKVSPETFSGATVGGAIQFEGEVGQPLKK